jgi:hypothetical protein
MTAIKDDPGPASAHRDRFALEIEWTAVGSRSNAYGIAGIRHVDPSLNRRRISGYVNGSLSMCCMK